MGTSLSTPGATASREELDMKFLGDRMPFGDEELIQVYRAYRTLKAKPLEERISFLTDIGSLSATNEEGEERMVLIQAAEHKILPPNFGNRLYHIAFLPPSTTSEYDTASNMHTMPPQEPDEYNQRVQLECFFEALADSSRRGIQKSLKILFDCCQTHTEDKPSAPSSAPVDFAHAGNQTSQRLIDPMEFVTLGYRVGLASAFLSNTDEEDVSRFFPADPTDAKHQAGLEALAQSLLDFAIKRENRHHRHLSPYETPTPPVLPNGKIKKHVHEQDVYEWAEQVAPMFGSSLATLMHTIFLPNRPYPPTRTKYDFPSLADFDSTFFSQGSSPLLFTFGCMSPALGGEYYRLYTSASDGLSFNRLQNALLGYSGPTLLMIESGKSLFGAFTASPWKESKDFYGNHDCFLYQILPTTQVYRPSGNASNFMYCNSFARSRGYDKQAHGIGFGGTVDQPRLFLAENFDDCRAAAQDLTFESGRLLDTKISTFELDHLEVWGVGGTEVVQEALGARSRQRDIKQAAIRKARKVDKAQFLDDFRSGVIESKAFAHREQIRGRDGLVIGDEDLKN